MGLTFKRVDAHSRARGGTVVTWAMTQPTPDDVTYTVWYSGSGVGAWQQVAAVVDGRRAVDVARRRYGVRARGAYKVVAEMADASVTSPAVGVDGVLLAHNDTYFAYITRLERMLLEKRTGTPGRLWKRKHAGPRCTQCTDPDSGEPTNSHCAVCFGTGIAGGYYAAVDYRLNLGDPRSRKMATGDAGTVETQKLVARGLPCPELDTGDVWMNCANDERWVVGGLQETLFNGRTLLYQGIELALAPAADVVYTLPIDGVPGGAAGGVLMQAGGLLVWDATLGAYYPVGTVAGGVVAMAPEAESYRFADGKLQVLDAATGVYMTIGLSGDAVVVYSDPSYGAPARIQDGQLQVQRDGDWVTLGFDNGELRVYE